MFRRSVSAVARRPLLAGRKPGVPDLALARRRQLPLGDLEAGAARPRRRVIIVAVVVIPVVIIAIVVVGQTVAVGVSVSVFVDAFEDVLDPVPVAGAARGQRHRGVEGLADGRVRLLIERRACLERLRGQVERHSGQLPLKLIAGVAHGRCDLLRRVQCRNGREHGGGVGGEFLELVGREVRIAAALVLAPEAGAARAASFE